MTDPENNLTELEPIIVEESHPLGLPQGSVRAIVTIMFCAAFIYCTIFGIPLNGLQEITILLVGLYTGSRMNFGKGG